MAEKKHDQEHKAQEDGRPDQSGPEAGPPEAESGLGQPSPAPPQEPEGAGAPERERETEEERSHKHKLTKKEAEIRALRHERDELKDKYLRLLAEMDNLRKRTEREKGEFYRYSLAELLKELLAVSDSFELALQADDQADGKVFQEGVRLIYRQLLDVLARKGVRPISDTVGSRFDPGLHQALSTEEADDVEEPVVSEELQRGYWIHDRLLRPALVKVKVPRKTAVD